MIIEQPIKRTYTVEEVSTILDVSIRKAYAVALARHYEMNVHVKVSDSLGIIELGNDEIMFDTLWNDGKLKRRFLLLILLASSSCMQSKTESRNTFLFIWMSYDLERRIRWS